MVKILFVCYGNICRSPMAEIVFNDKIKKLGYTNEYFAESRATSDEEIGNGVYRPVARLLIAHNLDYSYKRAERLKASDYFDFDYIIGMDEMNLRAMRALFGGDSEDKLYKLLSFSCQPRDILDPWYTRDFELCYNDISNGIDAFLAFLGVGK